MPSTLNHDPSTSPYTLRWSADTEAGDNSETYAVHVHQRGFSLVADLQATRFETIAEATQAIRKITLLCGPRGGHFEIVPSPTPLEKAQAALHLVAPPGSFKHVEGAH